MESDSTRSSPTVWLDGRYRQVIEQVDDYAIFTLTNEGRVITWNEGAERILGFSEEEALGQPGSFIFTPEDKKKARTSGNSKPPGALAKPTTSAGTCAGTAAASLRAGSDRSLRPGKPDGFTKILRDLTQQQQGKEERERLVAELKTLNETLEQAGHGS
jgi:PAS domain-containing protein